MNKSILKQLKEDERQVRRKLIINAAKALYGKESFHSIGMRDIAGEAGISVASLYQYFPSQDDLFVAILKDEMTNIMKDVMWNDKTSLEDISINIVDFLIDHEDIFLMMSHFMIRGEKRPESLEKFNEFQDLFLKMLESTIFNSSLEFNTRYYSHAFFTALFGNVITFRNYPYKRNTSLRENLYHIVRITARAFQDALQSENYLKLLSEEEHDYQIG